MSSYLIDSGILIRHLRGQRRFVQLLRGLASREQLAISAISRLEIRVGMREEEAYMTQRLLSRFLTYDVDRIVADRAGDMIRAAKHNEQHLSVPDAIIAATAVSHKLTLISLNVQDFHHVSGLSLYPIENE